MSGMVCGNPATTYSLDEDNTVQPVYGVPCTGDSERDIRSLALEERGVQVRLEVIWRRASWARRRRGHDMCAERGQGGLGV